MVRKTGGRPEFIAVSKTRTISLSQDILNLYGAFRRKPWRAHADGDRRSQGRLRLVFFADSKAYMNATSNVIDQEKMAVILSGSGRSFDHKGMYYPNILFRRWDARSTTIQLATKRARREWWRLPPVSARI